MNILYCGNKKIEDGLIISVLSMLKTTREPVNIYILTMDIEDGEYYCEPVRDETIQYLNNMVKQQSEQSFVKKYNVEELFLANIPKANLGTRFTPFCMLRLFADEIKELPDKILYLDNDVVCRKDIKDFYNTDLADNEIAGVLDYYGSWLFRNRIFKRDYINSGVLLLNLKKIKETGLFEKCRNMCRDEKMFMPDQSAINKLAQGKMLMPRRFNEQRKLKKETVMQHFTTSFRFFPWVRTVSVKPWDVDRMHSVLKLYEYDELLHEYKECMTQIDSAV